MCFGETGADTLHEQERHFLRIAVARHCPTFRFAIRGNDDGQFWAVLEPARTDCFGMRVTICRIDPSIMVMIEDRNAKRRFFATCDVEAAMACVRHANDLAILAAMNAHPAPAVLQ